MSANSNNMNNIINNNNSNSNNNNNSNNSNSNNGGGMSELHLKMSKKIAQLTKVIYHLNTKNEDHDFHLQELTDAYEKEIQDILKDASERLGEFRKVLEIKRDDTRIEQAVTALAQQHENEKRAAIEEFQAYKEKMRANEEKLVKDYIQIIKKLTEDTEALKIQFQERLNSFATVSKMIETNKDLNLDEVRKATKLEVQEVVRVYNEKYNNMLTEQLNNQHSLKLKYEAEITTLSDKLDKFEREKNSINKRTAELLENQELEHKQQMDLLKREMNQQMNDELNRFREKEANSNIKLRQTTENETKLQMNLENYSQRLKEMDDRIINLQEKLNSSNDKNSSLSKELQDFQMREIELNRQLNNSKEENENQVRSSISLQSQIAEQSKTIAALGQKLDEMKNSFNKEENQALSLREQLESKSMECLKLSQEFTQLQSSLQTETVQRQLTLVEIKKLNVTIEEMERRKENETNDLKRKHSDELILMQREMMENKRKNQEEMDRISSSLTDNLKSASEIILSKHKREISELEAAHANEIQQLQNDYESSQTSSKATFNEMQTTMTKLKNQIEEANQNMLKQRNEATMTKLVTEKESRDELAKRDVEISKLSKEKEELDIKNADLLSAIKIKDQQAKDLVEKQKEMIEENEKERKRLLSEREAISTSNSKTMESKYAEMLQQKLDDSRVNLNEAAKKEKERIISQLNDKWNIEKNLMNESFTRQLDATKFEIIEWKNKFEESKDNSKRNLDIVTKSHEDQISELKNRHMTELKQLNYSHQSNLKLLEESITGSLTKKYEKEKVTMTNQFNTERDELKSNHEKELIAQREKEELKLQDVEAHHKKQLSDWNENVTNHHENEKKKLIEEMRQKYENEMNIKSTKYNEILQSLQDQFNEVKQELKEKMGKVNNLEENERKLKSKIIETEELLVDANENMERIKSDFMTKTTESSVAAKIKLEKTLAENEEKHISNVRALNDEFRYGVEEWRNKFESMAKEMTDWKSKYENRESRPEDIQYIESIKAQLKDKEDAIKKLVKESEFFKLELLNREDNYNKMFGNHPNIGTMQVLKSKGNTNTTTAGLMTTGSSSSSAAATATTATTAAIIGSSSKKSIGSLHSSGSIGSSIGGIGGLSMSKQLQ